MQTVRVRPRAGQGGEQMTAGRVVHHLPQVGAELWVVRQAPMLLDVADEQQMMRQVRSGPGRQQVAPREPQEPPENGDDDGDECRQTGAIPR